VFIVGTTQASLDLAAALIRVALGPMLIMHGANKMFGAGGLAGTAGWFEALGLRPGALHARIASVTEMGAGFLITVGFLTPAGCAAFVGLMTVAAFTDHHGKGFFVFKGGYEYVLVVGLVAVALASFGPGRWSVDHALSWDSFHGVGWAAAAAVAGLIGAGGLLVSQRSSLAAARTK
jgi:putative oxidoreductase